MPKATSVPTPAERRQQLAAIPAGGLITRRGKDASLFADDDGKVYWVFGGGWIARMNDAITALAEEPRLIQPNTPSANTPGAEMLQVGTGGAFLFKKDGVYHLLAAGIHGRLGVPCYDTFVATARSLDGPWTQRKVAVAHGGQSTMFAGPDGQWYATFSGVDSRAALRERPAIVPVDWADSVHYFYPKDDSWPWKRPQVITEAWGDGQAVIEPVTGQITLSGLADDAVHLPVTCLAITGQRLGEVSIPPVRKSPADLRIGEACTRYLIGR